MVHTCHVTSTLVCDWLQLHHVMLQPGEMVWYESAKLLHGRSQPLNGTRLVADSNIDRMKRKTNLEMNFLGLKIYLCTTCHFLLTKDTGTNQVG